MAFGLSDWTRSSPAKEGMRNQWLPLRWKMLSVRASRSTCHRGRGRVSWICGASWYAFSVRCAARASNGLGKTSMISAICNNMARCRNRTKQSGGFPWEKVHQTGRCFRLGVSHVAALALLFFDGYGLRLPRHSGLLLMMVFRLTLKI
jgi:hypothetical protein